ncbi:hypothetical protein [Arthrobacter sp. 2MCAF14]
MTHNPDSSAAENPTARQRRLQLEMRHPSRSEMLGPRHAVVR